MEEDSYGILHPPADPASFLNIYPRLSDIADFVPDVLMNKDSTNMTPDDWTTIAQYIYNHRNDGFNGFVVVHGTDTMHFTASAIAFALGKKLSFPVVFTGAQTTHYIPYGDACVNLTRACKIATMDLAEVVICFGDYVFRGCRAQKKDERRFDAFESPACLPLAHIAADIVIHPWAKTSDNSTAKEEIVLRPNFAKGICQVSLIPGLEPELLFKLLNEKKCKGVVLQSFGAGNVPSDGPYSLTDFIQKSSDQGKPVLVTSQFPAHSTLKSPYEPGRKALDAGAIPVGNMTSACATVKFRWALAQVEAEGTSPAQRKLMRIADIMKKSYVQELDEEHKPKGRSV